MTTCLPPTTLRPERSPQAQSRRESSHHTQDAQMASPQFAARTARSSPASSTSGRRPQPLPTRRSGRGWRRHPRPFFVPRREGGGTRSAWRRSSPACGASAPRRAARRPAADGRAGRAARACRAATRSSASECRCRRCASSWRAPRRVRRRRLLKYDPAMGRRRRARARRRVRRRRRRRRVALRAVQASSSADVEFDVWLGRSHLPRLPHEHRPRRLLLRRAPRVGRRLRRLYPRRAARREDRHTSRTSPT